MAPTGDTRILIFGDQTFGYAPALGDLLLRSDIPYLSTFTRSINLALRRELASLEAPDRHLFPSFSDLRELLVHAKKGNRNVVIDGVLACFYHLCVGISYFSTQGWTSGRARHTYVVGFCVGSIAAAAVSCSRSISDLLELGVDAICIAVRTGLRAYHAAAAINGDQRQRHSEHGSWAVVLPHACMPTPDVNDAVAKFVKTTGVPPSSVPYISTYAQHSVTLSGPPKTLQDFIDRDVKLPSRVARLSISAPYHASHIHSQEDVERIVTGTLRSTHSHPGCQVISASSGKILGTSTWAEQLAEAVRHILVQQLDINAVSEAIAQLMARSTTKPVVLVPIGTSMVEGIVTSQGGTSKRDDYILEDALPRAQNIPGDEPAAGYATNSKLAIVGMSGRFPSAASTEDFWDLLYQGLDVHRVVPEDRFDVTAHFDESGKRKNTSKVRHGCWIDEPGLFDPKFFNISPKEAQQSDPGQRLALQTAYEAMERAGIVPDRTPSTRRERVGVFYGMTSDDWREVNSGQDVDTYFIPGGNRAFTPGRLNYFFKFSGPSASVDTACSSSLAAIHMACNSLWMNDCDTAFAGGTNVMTNPDNFAGLDRGYFLSRTGNCKTFDDDADGYCRADGVGTIILKRLEDAEMDNDPILGVIVGAYTNHSAEAVSITRPHAGAQEYIFSKLLNNAGIDTREVSYIEMHGTGTQAGDATEMTSVLDTFAPDYGRSSSQSLHLGSAKANVGHGESASGVTSLIKVLLMMEKNIIPPHCGIKGSINHKFPKDLAQRNVHIAQQPTEWHRPNAGKGKRRAFVNNFSAAGGNSAVLLEDHAIQSVASHDLEPDIRSAHIIAVSAKSSFSLRKNLEKMASFVSASRRGTDVLAQLSYTTTARRMHHPFRFSTVAANLDDLESELQTASSQAEFARTRSVTPAVAFVFSGQGAQYLGMGQHLFESNTVFRVEILRYNQMCINQGYGSVLPIIAGDLETLPSNPTVVQLATTCLQMALASLWESLGIKPDILLGHSLGHYAALKSAGVLSATDVIHLVGARAQLLERKCSEGTHSMLAIRATLEQLQPLLNSVDHEIACINGPKEVVVSGEAGRISELSDKLANHHIKATCLVVPYAFHSSQVDNILDDFEKIASGVVFNPPHTPIMSALLAETVHAGEDNVFGPRYLRRHCRETVLFKQSLERARSEDLVQKDTVWIEIGPHTHCSSFLKSTLGSETVTVPSLRRDDDGWKVLATSLSLLYQAGLPIDWNEFHRPFGASHHVLPLPTYSWDNKTYWIQYEHNWTLTKGDAPALSTGLRDPPSGLSTASVQEILHQNVDGSVVTILAQSDFASSQLSQVAHGHRVNGVKLCTSSLYADVALTMGQYLLDTYRSDLQGYKVNVEAMSVDKTLVLPANGPSIIRISVSYDIGEMTASMLIYSIDEHGSRSMDHAQCLLRFEDPRLWSLEWGTTQYLIHRSIEYLEKRAESGEDSRLSRSMIYKMFSTLVDYDPGFMGLESVIFHGEDYEATAKVKLQPPGNMRYSHNPLWIDSFGQLAGFLMNSHQLTPVDQVFINHGWSAMRCLREFEEDKDYRSYVRMRCIDGTTFGGDVYILDDKEIIAVYSGIKFQGIPRRVLDTVLPRAVSTTTDISKRRIRSRDAMVPTTANHPEISARPGTAPAPPAADMPAVGLIRPILRIVSEEIDIPLASLKDDLVFSDYGVDSLLALSITGRIREELDVNIESSVFLTCETLGDIKLLFEDTDVQDVSPSSGSMTDKNGSSTPLSTPEDDGRDAVFETARVEDFPSSLRQYRATSNLLQGKPSEAKHVLFLFPDGSGSATSYATIDQVGADVCIYGLNCPWLKTADKLVEFGLNGLAALYVEEIRRRRPHGPYSLGGWSAGGICAYEAAIRLTKEGETVDHLLLLDSPGPIGLEKLPPRLFDFLNGKGVFGDNGKTAPDWLLGHFLAFIDALDAYEPIPWNINLGYSSFDCPAPPKTSILWAEDGVCKEEADQRPEYRPGDPREMRWLLENRHDFGPNGWDVLLGNDITIGRLVDANHFTMLRRGESTKKVAEFIAEMFR